MTKNGKKRPTPKKRLSPGYKKPPPIPLGVVITDHMSRNWKIGPSIGIGGFGEIYSACQAGSGDEENYPYVVKIEPIENGPLFVEENFYKNNYNEKSIKNFMVSRNLSHLGMPVFIGKGETDVQGVKLRFLVLERYGTDVNKLFEESGKKFPAPTVFQLGLQVLDVLDYIHSRSYIHADIKGANILMGVKEGAENQAYLLDYGLAWRIVGENYQPNRNNAHEGTLEYTSRDRHSGAQTMRGDLEILAYNMLQWLVGKLPWEQVEDQETVHKMKNQFMNHARSRLTADYPRVPGALIEFFEYINTLNLGDQPDYTECRNMFEGYLTSVGKTRISEMEFKATNGNKQLSEDTGNNTRDDKSLSDDTNNRNECTEIDSENISEAIPEEADNNKDKDRIRIVSLKKNIKSKPTERTKREKEKQVVILLKDIRLQNQVTLSTGTSFQSSERVTEVISLIDIDDKINYTRNEEVHRPISTKYHNNLEIISLIDNDSENRSKADNLINESNEQTIIFSSLSKGVSWTNLPQEKKEKIAKNKTIKQKDQKVSLSNDNNILDDENSSNKTKKSKRTKKTIADAAAADDSVVEIHDSFIKQKRNAKKVMNSEKVKTMQPDEYLDQNKIKKNKKLSKNKEVIHNVPLARDKKVTRNKEKRSSARKVIIPIESDPEIESTEANYIEKNAKTKKIKSARKFTEPREIKNNEYEIILQDETVPRNMEVKEESDAVDVQPEDYLKARKRKIKNRNNLLDTSDDNSKQKAKKTKKKKNKTIDTDTFEHNEENTKSTQKENDIISENKLNIQDQSMVIPQKEKKRKRSLRRIHEEPELILPEEEKIDEPEFTDNGKKVKKKAKIAKMKSTHEFHSEIEVSEEIKEQKVSKKKKNKSKPALPTENNKKSINYASESEGKSEDELLIEIKLDKRKRKCIDDSIGDIQNKKAKIMATNGDSETELLSEKKEKQKGNKKSNNNSADIETSDIEYSLLSPRRSIRRFGMERKSYGK